MKRGFTLIELIVVIAIIAVMGAVIAPNAFKSIEKAKIAATVQDLNSIKTAAAAYFTDVSAWPPDSANFTSNPASQAAWDGPYLDKWPAGLRWPSSTYAWTSASGTHFYGTAGQERYVTLNNLGSGIAVKLDQQLDPGNNNTTGPVRVTSASTIEFLVSRDGPVQ